MGGFLSVRDVEVKGQKVFLRLDLNVPLDDGRIRDDTRIQAAVRTISYLLEHGAMVVACSHLGRPKGQYVPALSLAPVAECLRQLLPGRNMHFAADIVGPDATALSKELKPGELLLLENIRFEPGETSGDGALAKALWKLAPDIYVNDAFGAAHRPHASVFALPCLYMKVVMGFLLERELAYLVGRLGTPERPYLAILGGAKVSDKVPVLKALADKVDALCIGGAMAYTFLAARGIRTGASLIEKEQIPAAREIMESAGRSGVCLSLPGDHVVARAIDDEAGAHAVPTQAIPDGMMGFDIGPVTAQTYAAVASRARTVLWNGPMGVFERPAFAAGTMTLAKALADTKAITVVGGGDSVAAVKAAGVGDKISHISTGGGASLELLAGMELPGLKVLSRK